MATHFKGWAKPGPVPPAAESSPDVPADETLDALSGHFRVFQLRRGHRFSTDDVLTAWYGTSWAPCARSALDLGSGIGSVGMIAAWRLEGASAWQWKRRRRAWRRRGSPRNFLMMRASDLPPERRERTWDEPPLVIRSADRSIHPKYAAIKLSVGFHP